jgi:hypothetical protein
MGPYVARKLGHRRGPPHGYRYHENQGRREGLPPSRRYQALEPCAESVFIFGGIAKRSGCAGGGSFDLPRSHAKSRAKHAGARSSKKVEPVKGSRLQDICYHYVMHCVLPQPPGTPRPCPAHPGGQRPQLQHGTSPHALDSVFVTALDIARARPSTALTHRNPARLPRTCRPQALTLLVALAVRFCASYI